MIHALPIPESCSLLNPQIPHDEQLFFSNGKQPNTNTNGAKSSDYDSTSSLLSKSTIVNHRVNRTPITNPISKMMSKTITSALSRKGLSSYTTYSCISGSFLLRKRCISRLIKQETLHHKIRQSDPPSDSSLSPNIQITAQTRRLLRRSIPRFMHYSCLRLLSAVPGFLPYFSLVLS